MKIAVYTAVTGNYDSIKPAPDFGTECDCICFTDTPPENANGWEIRLIPEVHTPKGLDPIRLARHVKTSPHHYLPEYDASIWIDGSYQVIGDILHFAKKVLQTSDMALFQHPEDRQGTYQEAEVCLKRGKGNVKEIAAQINTYKAEQYEDTDIIPATGVIFRNHKQAGVIRCMDTWWNEISQFSTRDQISFHYACAKSNQSYRMLPHKLNTALLKHASHSPKACCALPICKKLKCIIRQAFYKFTIGHC